MSDEKNGPDLRVRLPRAVIVELSRLAKDDHRRNATEMARVLILKALERRAKKA